jgi:hypothetical protein
MHRITPTPSAALAQIRKPCAKAYGKPSGKVKRLKKHYFDPLKRGRYRLDDADALHLFHRFGSLTYVQYITD